MFQCRPADAIQTPSSRVESRKRLMPDRRLFSPILALGCGIVGLLVVAVVAASAAGSPIRAGSRELSDVPGALFLATLACAFVLYAASLVLIHRRGSSLAAICAIAAAIQLTPLAGPLLLSRDVQAYWAYGRIADDHGSNPYVSAPGRFEPDPAVRAMAPAWRGTRSVYGPVFTGASAGLAETTGGSAETNAFAYRLLAAFGMLALVALAAVAAPRRAFAAAFVGWNPLLAVHFAGGGHNDVWTAVFLVGALALAARERAALSGASWALAAGLKWAPLALLPLSLLARRRHALRTGAWFVAAAAAIAAVAFALFGTAWLTALLPFAHRRAAYALPSRLGQLDLPGWLALVPLLVALPWLVRSARRGRPRLAVTSILMLGASPWVLPWYAIWVVPLAAIEDDGLAWVLAIAVSAYLLPDRIPL
jgi:alpha-1,6-mannosyltransferase